MYAAMFKKISDKLLLADYYGDTPLKKLVYSHAYKAWFVEFFQDPVHRIVGILENGDWSAESYSGTTSQEGTFYCFTFNGFRMEIPEDEFNEIWTGIYGPNLIYGHRVVETTRYGRPVRAVAVSGWRNFWVVNVCNPESNVVDLMIVDVNKGNEPMVVGTLEVLTFLENCLGQSVYRKVRGFVALRHRGEWFKW